MPLYNRFFILTLFAFLYTQTPIPGRLPGITRSDGLEVAARHKILHYIATTPVPPVAHKLRRFALEKLQAVKAEFNTILKLLAEEWRPMANTTPFWVFGFPYMTFGLRNGLKRSSDSSTRCCGTWISAKPMEQLDIIFERLWRYSVIINPSKCVFGQLKVKFLRYLISNATEPLPAKVNVIRAYTRLFTIKELC